jgi:hypothetical protein
MNEWLKRHITLQIAKAGVIESECHMLIAKTD